MKRNSGQLCLIAFALLIAFAIGCKMSSSSSSSTSSSNTNDQRDSSKSSSSNSSSSTSTSAPAPAPDVAGHYNIVGSNPNGAPYKGTLEVITRGDVYQFRWNAGTQYDGVGVQNGKVVAVAFANGPNGKGCGVVDFDIAANGSLNGKWGYWGTNEAGTESATRTSGSGPAGEYDGTGKNPSGTQYKVKLTVEPAGNLYHFVWSNNTEGVGIKRGDNVAVGIGGTRCGFVMYEVQSDGTLDGMWGGGGSDKTGTERATKQ
jgi:hypothetical protein